MTECDSSALDAAAKGNNGFYPVFLGISNNFSLPVEAFVAGAKCLQLEYGGHFPKLCGLTSSMITTTATSINDGFQGIYNFPYNNNRALMPNKFKTCHTEQASRRAMESSSFFEMHDAYSFSQISFIGSEEQQECNIVLRREESTSKGLAFVATKPGTADDEDFVSYSGPVLFDSGNAEVQFPISIKDDQQVEAEEFFFVNIVSANTSSQTRIKREH